MYQGKADEAAAEINKINTKARSDGERRAALFGLTVLAADSGKLDQALAEVDQQYALGEKTGDVPNMAGDLQLRGNILLEAGKYDEAKQAYERSLKMTLDSNLSPEIKGNAKLFHHYHSLLLRSILTNTLKLLGILTRCIWMWNLPRTHFSKVLLLMD